MSAPLEIVPVRTKRDQKTFINVAWELNQHDPQWIPPLIANHKGLLNYKPHPFYEDAAIQTFLAIRAGKPVGRIAAIENRSHNQWHKDKIGFCGFFQSIDDQAVADALFSTAGEWLQARGLTSLRGPAEPSINYEWGLLVDGFETPPFFMLTHNPRYYPQLWESAGFVKSQDLYGFWGDTSMVHMLKSDEKIRTVDEQIRERFGITIRPMNRRNFRAEVEMFLDIYNQALSATWGYVPMGRKEVLQLASELKHLIVPELAAHCRGRWQTDRHDVRALGLQHAHQANQRPLVSLWVHSAARQQARDQTDSPGEHQCAARVPKLGRRRVPGPRDAATGPRPRRDVVRVQLGAGIERSLAQNAGEGWRVRYKTWRLYDRPL